MTTIILDPKAGCIYTDTRITYNDSTENNKVKIHIPTDSFIEYNGVKYDVVACGISGRLLSFTGMLIRNLKGVDMYKHIKDNLNISWYNRDVSITFHVLCKTDDGFTGFKIALQPGYGAEINKVDDISTGGTGGLAVDIYRAEYPDLTPMELLAMVIRLNADRSSGGFISVYDAKVGNYVMVYGNDVAKEQLASARQKVVSHILS